MPESMLVQLLDLPASGWHWHGLVSHQQLEDSGRGRVAALSGLEGDARWDVDLEHVGDCYHLHGNWQIAVWRRCRRCNIAFVLHMQGETQREFRLGDPMAADAEEDVLLPPGHVDLLDVLREDVWLAWQPNVVCKPDCRGLCQRCGQNLNEGSCGCRPEEGEHPFAVLRDLKALLTPKQ